jgi:diaminopimelate decarboxylase
MKNRVCSLIAKRFPESCSELIIGRVPVRVLAETYGTPLFVYDRAVIDAQLDALRAALPSRFTVYFSIKANPNRAVVEHFLTRGCGLEIASAGEFLTALDAGCDATNILFAGPGKTEAELDLVLSHGIGEIHIESVVEARRVGNIARRLGVRAPVAIRVNPTIGAEGGAMRMGGRPAPFGIDEELLDAAISTVSADSTLEFRGIHVFAGTQILDAEVLLNQYRHGIEIAQHAARQVGRPLPTVDLGGGLGIPYFAHEQELNLELVREGVATLWSEIEGDPAFSGSHFIVEPGRFLTAEAGVYIARVSDVKVSRGKKFVVVNGGMNHHLAASGNLGQTIKRNYPVALLNKLNAPNAEVVDVVGPLCTPLDTLARNVKLPTAEVGDLFGIFQSGAYARSASPLGFLSHPAPPEVWIDAGRSHLITERGSTSGVQGAARAGSSAGDRDHSQVRVGKHE